MQKRRKLLMLLLIGVLAGGGLAAWVICHFGIYIHQVESTSPFKQSSTRQIERLCQAVDENDMPKVISLLNANVDIDGMPWLNSCIPLYHAIVKQNTDMISYLLNRGARVELACGKNAGPNLLYCSGQTRNAMVLKIIAQHWEGNSTDLITGYTGALYGCLKDCIGYNQNQSPGAKYYPAKLWGTQSYFNAVTCFITEELIRDGADVNGKDFAGVTPLHLAIEAHRKDLALMLIRYGAKSDTPDNQGFTPRIIAKQKGMGDLFTNKNLHTPNARR